MIKVFLKGASLDSLCKKLGLTNVNVMALGDGLNDLSMIEFAGLGVAVENGNSILKEAADFYFKKVMMKMVLRMQLRSLY